MCTQVPYRFRVRPAQPIPLPVSYLTCLRSCYMLYLPQFSMAEPAKFDPEQNMQIVFPSFFLLFAGLSLRRPRLSVRG